jgi:hypothetical protein
VDLSKLNTNDWLVGGGAIAFLISMFLPWYGLTGASNSGFDYFLTGWIPLLLIIVAFVLTVLPKLADGVNLPDEVGPLPRLQAAMIAAVVAAVLVLLRLLITSSVEGFGVSVDLDRKFGLFIALLAAIAVAAGAFLKMQAGDEDTGSSSTAPPTPF